MIKAILFDMDGVLVDFARGFTEKAGFECAQHPVNRPQGEDSVGGWLEKNAIETGFFRDLPGMPDFHHMLQMMRNLAFNYEVRILSSCGDYDAYKVREDKRIWLDNNGLERIQFNYCESSYQKGFFADRHSLLIDDYNVSCQAFRYAGGKAIQHTDYRSTLEQLREHGIEI